MSTTTNRKGEPKKSPLVNGLNKREERQDRAEERAEARESRGNASQLRALDLRLGVAVGAKRERERLVNRIAGGKS